ncbi:MAG: sulfurtransferase [Acidobacteriota bacterium]|nr:sulfurtransferase [Acidobacteriota bacterium]
MGFVTMHTTLITPAELSTHLGNSRWVVVDCRFDLANTAWGEEQYAVGHIPGARYAHLDRHLSGAKTGTNGRHPLPTIDEMTTRFGAMGIGPDTQVVTYDADSGMYAARLWWMLRFMGHDAVAVLDGGLARWVAEGGMLQPGRVTPTPARFEAAPRANWRLTVEDAVAAGESLMVDARSPERFRGLNETLDAVGGHIPGARNYFFQQNLTEDKTFKPADALRAQWDAVLLGRPPAEVVMYCGSGVTACHNLLAMEVAGLPGCRMFPGSWSEWSADPTRPVET